MPLMVGTEDIYEPCGTACRGQICTRFCFALCGFVCWRWENLAIDPVSVKWCQRIQAKSARMWLQHNKRCAYRMQIFWGYFEVIHINHKAWTFIDMICNGTCHPGSLMRLVCWYIIKLLANYWNNRSCLTQIGYTTIEFSTIISNHIRSKKWYGIIYRLPWKPTFLSRVKRFGKDFYGWRSHERKSFPIRLTSNQKSVFTVTHTVF